ncbi:MAG: C45 family autoproteolytic acyltransferase/hydrolase [Actinomycetes bacterium]
MIAGPTLPFVNVAGSHRQVGHQIGEACATAVRDAATLDHGEVPRDGRTMAEQLKLAAEYRRVTAECLPYLVEEMDAVAEAADVDPVRVFAASIEEIWRDHDAATISGSSNLSSERGRCTDLVVGPPATASGDVLIAHNNDLNASVESKLVAIEWKVDDEPGMFTIGVGPWISVGWNSAGLALSGNELAPNDNRVGVPRLLLVREQLRHSTVEEAVSAALHPARASAYNTIFASPDGKVVNVEGSATDGAVSSLDDTGAMVHTNHYVCSSMLQYEDDHAYAKRSARRYERGSELLADASAEPGSVTEEMLLQFLGDHANAPDSLCRHPTEATTSKTVFWCLTNVTQRTITYGRGNPCAPTPQTYRFLL